MRKIGILIKKEIMEILRDKKTLIIMVLVPLIMYPLLIIGMTLGMSLIMQSEEEQEHIVGYYLEDKAYLQPIEELYQQEEWDFEISFVGASAENKNAVLDMADVWIGFEERAEGIYITVDYTSANTESEYTADALEELADRYREELLMANLVREGLSKDFLYPVFQGQRGTVCLIDSRPCSWVQDSLYQGLDLLALLHPQGCLQLLFVFIRAPVFQHFHRHLAHAALGGFEHFQDISLQLLMGRINPTQKLPPLLCALGRGGQ